MMRGLKIDTASERLAWWILVATLFLTALYAVPAGDTFRLPKDAALRAGAIALLAAIAIGTIWNGPPQWLRLRDRRLLIPAAGVMWALLSAAFAHNHRLSAVAALDILSSAVFFFVAVAVLRTRSEAAIAVLFIPAIVNAIVLALQVAHFWQPFRYTIELPERLRRTALVGNPDDVGMYFTAVIVAAAALAVGARGRVRLAGAVTALVGIASLIATQSLTAIAAAAAGLAALVLLLLRRKAIIAVIVLFVAGTAILTASPAGSRIRDLWAETVSGHVPATVAGRAVATLSAGAMFRDNPLLGVGPGCFAWDFFSYKQAVERRWPELRGIVQENFGEAHNDHAQLLAETGLPGYLIVLAALVTLAAISFRPVAESRGRFGRLAAFPLAVSFAVLGLALFPLHIASARTAFLFVAAAATAWSTEGDEAAG